MKKILRTLKKLIRKNKGKSVHNIIVKLHPADLAELFPLLTTTEQIYIFKRLDVNMAGEVLDASNETIQEDLISNSDTYFITAVLENLYADEAVDILSNLSVQNAEKIINLMHSEEAKEIKELLFYEPYTAGRIMTLDYISINKNKTAQEAIEIIRKDENAEMSHYVYITGDNNSFIGVLPFQKLVFANPNMEIGKLTDKNSYFVLTDADQEEAVKLVRKYDLLAIPVVDNNNILKGIITVDDIIEILRDENSEDFFRMAGSAEKNPISESVLKKVGLRFPWLIITLAGGIACSFVMHSFDASLSKMVAVAFFTPLILALAGNISIQSSTIMVRGIATGEITDEYSIFIILKEISSGIIMGFLFGIISGFVAMLMQDSFSFGLLISISMVISTLTAACYGTLIPLACHKVKIDPALTSGPFVLILTDLSALFIYLTLSTKFFFN